MHRRCSTLSARSMDRSEHAMQSLARPPPRPQNSPQQHNEEEGGRGEGGELEDREILLEGHKKSPSSSFSGVLN